MREARLVCIPDIKQLAVCDPLLADYIAWIKLRLSQDYSFNLSTDSIARIRNEVRCHWPMYSGQQGCFLLASVGQHPGGMAAIRHAANGICELKRLYVSPPYRRAGLGRLLVGRLLAEARRLAYTKVRLETLAFMVEAIRLYESFGFVRTAEFAGTEGRNHGIQDHELYFSLHL